MLIKPPEYQIMHDRYSEFEELLEYPLMQSEINKNLLAILFINESFGVNGILERKAINISNFKADYAFTYPLMIYDFYTRITMQNVEDAIRKSKDIHEFKKNLNPISKAVVYAHLLAIIDFHLYPVDMIHNVNHRIFRDGLYTLYRHTLPLLDIFRPDIHVPGNLKYTMPDKQSFCSLERSTGWYLCATDLSWTKQIFSGIKSSLYSVKQYPFYGAVRIVEHCSQKFFDYYASAINGIKTPEEYIILRMVWGLDSICYKDFIDYYSCTGLINNEFISEFENFSGTVDDLYILSQVRWDRK